MSLLLRVLLYPFLERFLSFSFKFITDYQVKVNFNSYLYCRIKILVLYTMEYYSAIKRNEIELFVVRWMDLESVIQSEVSQKEKNKYRMLTLIYGI